jgi:hypothetical protein
MDSMAELLSSRGILRVTAGIGWICTLQGLAGALTLRTTLA